MPTRPEVEKWNTGKLSEWAGQIDTAVGTYEAQLGRMISHFNGTTWVGAARDAAYDRFAQENTEARKLSQEIHDATAALRAADSRLGDERRVLLGKVADAEHDPESPLPLKVSDRWVVDTAIRVAAGSQKQDVIDKVKQRIDHHQGLINTAYYSLADAITEMSRAITNANQNIRARGEHLGTGVDAPDTPTDAAAFGREDGKAVRDAVHPDGTIDHARLAEIAGNLPEGALTENDLRDLAQGKDVATLPAATQQYLHEFYNSAGKDGILALSEELKTEEAHGNPAASSRRDALANGLMVLSNERVGTGRGADGSLQSPGGYKQLPDDIRTLVSTRVGGPDANSNLYPVASPGSPAAQVQFLAETKQFGDLIKHSDTGVRPGTEFSRELTRQAANLAGPNRHDVEMLGPQLDRSAFEGPMRDYLEVSGRNHQATTELLTGQTEPGSPPLEPGYDRAKVFQPLLQYDWNDSGGKKAPELFDWIGQEATPHPAHSGQPEVTPDQSRLAGHAASGLAQFLTSNTPRPGAAGEFETLMNMPDHDNKSLGMVNPGLTQQLTRAMTPYLDNIAGAPGNPTPDFALHGDHSADRDIQAIRLSTLFNTDHNSSALWNAAISERTNNYAAQHAALAGHPSNDRDGYADAAGRLAAYQEQGLRAEAIDRQLDAKDAAEQIAGRKKLGVDIAGTVLSDTVGEKLPVAGTAIDVTGKVLADQVKPEYTKLPDEQTGVLESDQRVQRYYSMLQARAAQDPNFFEHQPADAKALPPDWLDHGQLRSLNEIVGQPGSENHFHQSNQFSSAAESWLNATHIETDRFDSGMTKQRDQISGYYAGVPDFYKSRILKGN